MLADTGNQAWEKDNWKKRVWLNKDLCIYCQIYRDAVYMSTSCLWNLYRHTTPRRLPGWTVPCGDNRALDALDSPSPLYEN